MRPTTRLALLLALALASPSLAGDAMVNVGHDRLGPAEITVKAGTTVVFQNLDEMPGGHSLAADDGSFASPPLGKDEKWSHTFSEPGTFTYAIKEHPAVKGTVVVEAE